MKLAFFEPKKNIVYYEYNNVKFTVLFHTSTCYLIAGYDRSPRSTASKVLMVTWFIYAALALIMYMSSMINHLFWASSVQVNLMTQNPLRSLESVLQVYFFRNI